MGIVDFDVLDAVNEFLDACDAAAVRGSAGIETRVYVPEFADREINSPGEPGVLYHMGIGFTRTARAAGGAGHRRRTARAVRRSATARSIARVNAYLDPVTIDYEQDVLPLTPAGNATERHIVVAYIEAAAAHDRRSGRLLGRQPGHGSRRRREGHGRTPPASRTRCAASS